LNEEKRKMDDDYKARIETNLVMISTVRSEIDDNKQSLGERKTHNNHLYSEIDRQKESLGNRNVEISRLKGDLVGQQDLNQSLQGQKRQLEDDLTKLRERNHEDTQEIDKLNLENDSKGKESVDMAAQIRALEYDISKSLGKIDDL
jgi:chromosome segregation ATPase